MTYIVHCIILLYSQLMKHTVKKAFVIGRRRPSLKTKTTLEYCGFLGNFSISTSVKVSNSFT